MRTKPGPGQPEMGKRIDEVRELSNSAGRDSLRTRRLLYATWAVLVIVEVIRWLV